ncbi:hypothetical protein F2Q69_00035878 [Brassica cretica]|uniref:Uncharacterized protein n=1 Tax=Brassica cretica TaxID=69181 RepID=A0A8S9SNL1_BRACR|nr:hypothetical protein F2Q69_00035878 [Brassica cretica]
MEQGQENTMMGSHPGGRVTICIIRCSILEYVMEMVVTFISPLGLAIRSILRTSDRPSRNINRVISGQLRSGVSQPSWFKEQTYCSIRQMYKGHWQGKRRSSPASGNLHVSEGSTSKPSGSKRTSSTNYGFLHPRVRV